MWFIYLTAIAITITIHFGAKMPNRDFTYFGITITGSEKRVEILGV